MTWRVEKKISLSLIAGALFYIISAVWYASSLNSRVGSIEKIVNSSPPLNERMANIETGMLYIAKSQERIENKLDKVPGKSNAVYTYEFNR